MSEAVHYAESHKPDAAEDTARVDETPTAILLRLVDTVHLDNQRIEATYREETRQTREAVATAVATVGEQVAAAMDRTAEAITRSDKTSRFALWVVAIVTVVGFVALGAVVNSRLLVEVAGLRVGAEETPAQGDFLHLVPPESPVGHDGT